MRILHIISALASGGAEIYVRDLSKQMVAEGHNVCIAYISDSKSIGRAVDFENKFKRELEESEVEFIELGNDCLPYKLWVGGHRLRRAIKSFKPDVIHSHLYYGLLFRVFAFTNVPTLYTHHTSLMLKGKYLYPLFNRFVTRYIGISKGCANALSSGGASPVVTIYNGVNAARLHIKEDFIPQGEDVVILAVGRLSKEKNFGLLIDAFSDLLNLHPEYRTGLKLQIAGEGPLDVLLQQKIDSYGFAENISLLGNRSDISNLLWEADIFVMSSNFEGLPISLLEALMTGLPAIVTDVGGCRELVETCNAGIVVPPHQRSELALALGTMIANPEQRYQMGLNAREGSKRFSIESACAEHLIVYKSLIKSDVKTQ